MRNAWDVREDAFVRYTNEREEEGGQASAFNYRRYTGSLQMFRR